MDVDFASTKELVNELIKRGAISFTFSDKESFASPNLSVPQTGPATVLIIKGVEICQKTK